MRIMVIDNETLGTNNRAPILSVGMVVFDTEQMQMLHQAQVNIDMREYDEPQWRGRFNMQYSTLEWWLKQEPAVFLQARVDGVTLQAALEIVANIYHGYSCEQIWAQGPQFDVAQLDHAFTVAKLPVPWKYNAPRDCRTIKDFMPQGIKDEIKKRYTEHVALDDALYETACLYWWFERRTWNHTERRDYSEFAKSILGEEQYNNSPCQAHPFELIENYVRELENKT